LKRAHGAVPQVSREDSRLRGTEVSGERRARLAQLPHDHVFARYRITSVVKPPSPRAESRALSMGFSF
jgi:hypothetical protein